LRSVFWLKNKAEIQEVWLEDNSVQKGTVIQQKGTGMLQKGMGMLQNGTKKLQI
jgi:hypothetical protein